VARAISFGRAERVKTERKVRSMSDNKMSGKCGCQVQFRDAVAKKAQEIYEKNGRKPGRDLENWLEAERIIKKQVC